MFADFDGDNGLVKDGTHKGVLLVLLNGHAMRTVATAIDLSRSIVRLVAKPFLLCHNEPHLAGSFAHLPIRLVRTEDVKPLTVHLSDAKQAAGDAGDLGAFLILSTHQFPWVSSCGCCGARGTHCQ